jgi:2-dehydro-3-deoxygluconokinase
MAKYDFMSFGEAMVRFTPHAHDRLGQAEYLELGIAAAELNCCVNISNLSRELLKPTMKTGFVTKLVDAWDGDYIIKHAQMHAVDMSNVVVDKYDKVGRVRNGKCFIETGIGYRAGYQGYDRGHSVVSLIKPGDIDWQRVLDTRWFHSTGIVTAVGEHTATEVEAALKAAKDNGATTSFDLNYRYTLWSEERAQATMKKLMPYIDVIIGNEEDFETMLGIKADGVDRTYSKIDPMEYKKVAEKVMRVYPNVQAVGNSLREVKSALLNNWQVVLMTKNGYFVSRKYDDVEIYDRVGGGDSFASGVIYGMLLGKPEQEIIDFAGAYSALCHTIRNDWNLVTREEAEDVMRGGSARVKR